MAEALKGNIYIYTIQSSNNTFQIGVLQAINGHDVVASTLLDSGADVTLVDDSGLTAVDVAKTKKVRNTLKQVLLNGKDGQMYHYLQIVTLLIIDKL